MRPRLFSIAILLILLTSGTAAALLFSDDVPQMSSGTSTGLERSRADRSEHDEDEREARTPRVAKPHTQKVNDRGASPKPEEKPKEGDDKPAKPSKQRADSKDVEAVTKRLSAEPAAEAKPASKLGTDLPEKIVGSLEDGKRLNAGRAMRVRAGRGGVRQSRQGTPPPNRKLDPPAAGSVPEDTPATVAKLRAGLYTELYKLSEPATAFFVRNEEPTKGGPTSTRIDNYIEFKDRDSFQLGFDSDDFIVRWSGFIKIEQDTALYLGLGNNLAGSLSIDGQAVIVNDVFSWYVETWAAVTLSRGYHRITVEHVGGNSYNDKNRTSSCRLVYKTEWNPSQTPPRIPSTWFFQPEFIGATGPEITKVSPANATLEDDIVIEGSNLADPISQGPEDALLDSASGIEVYIDGVPAELKSVANTKITAKVPAGAGSSDVEVRRHGIPSNRMPLNITSRFGLVVSVWDMSKRAGSAVPEGEPADFVVLDDNPFPMTRDKYPQFAGKPIAIRLEGQMAMHEVVVSNEFHYLAPAGTSDEEKKEARAKATEKAILGGGYQIRAEGAKQAAKARVTVFGAAKEYAFRSALGVNPLARQAFGVRDGSGRTIEVEPLVPALPYWDFTLTNRDDYATIPSGWDLSSTESGLPAWAPITADLFFPLSDGKEDWVEPLFDLEPTTVHNAKRVSHFRPNFIPPEPPIIFAFAEHYIDDEGQPATFGAPVDGELNVLVNTESLNFAGPAEQRLAFFVDDVPASYLEGYRKFDGSIDKGERYQVIDGVQRAFKVVRVKVPDGAGDGALRARMGIVQSDILNFDVSNRGLVGFYYDFDEVLRDIPNVTTMLPIVRRIDKKLEFESNAIFNLPFPAERFSAEWYGQIRVPEGGEWTFIIQSDDGFRLKIDNKVVSEFPGLRPPRESQGKVTLKAGWHDLHIEYYENDVIENYVMWWVPPGKSERERIPTKHYRTQRDAGIPDKQPAVKVVDVID